MKNAKQIVLMITLCISQLFIQCSNDDNKLNEEKTGKETYTEEISFLRNYISTSTGIDIKKIIYDSKQFFFYNRWRCDNVFRRS